MAKETDHPDRGFYAAIDVGTNTLRLLIGEVEPSGRIKTVLKERVITRLGGGFYPGIGISEDAFLRSMDALKSFSQRLSSLPVRRLRAVGTSILRRAKNTEDFIKKVLKETGINIEVISGEEEATLSLKGVLSIIGSVLNFIRDDDKRGVIVDIGGGSTEYIFYDGELSRGYSLDMGVVDMAEGFLKSNPIKSQELRKMEKRIAEVLNEFCERVKGEGIIELSHFSQDNAVLVGTAGTPTTLAAIDQSMEVYNPERVNGYILEYDRLKEIYKRLSSMLLEERRRVKGIEKGREDVIIPGTAIVLNTMKAFGFQRMVVSDAGLLEGVLLSLWQEDRNIVGHSPNVYGKQTG